MPVEAWPFMMKFRPRFSVRTLAIFVTLVCCYFAAWEATKRYDGRSPAPFIHIHIRTLAIVVTLVCAYFGAWGTV